MRPESWPELSCCIVVTVMEHVQLPGKAAMDGSCKKCQLQRPTSAQRCLHEPLPFWLSRRQLSKVSTYLIRTKPCGKMGRIKPVLLGVCKEEVMSLSESIVITPERRTHFSLCFCPMRGRRGACLGVRSSERLAKWREPSATVILLRYPCASGCSGYSFSVL